MKRQVSTNQQNNKYLSRCQYYGKLIDWDYVEECMVLKFAVYTATEYYGNTSTIRIYVPTEMEDDIINELFKLIMENASDPRLQSYMPINQSIAPAVSTAGK